MQLIQLHSFYPQKYSYHLSHTLINACHPSSLYLAFVTRNNEIAYHNRKTGRTSILYSSKNGIVCLLFTQRYLIAIQKGTPEIFVFSIKTQKIKKKLAGHRLNVLAISFCPQRQIFCTASHDVCIIWDEATLSQVKLLKCSTSTYCDCHFTINGQYLFTAFADGNIFGWDLQTYEPIQYALSIEPHKVTSTSNQFVAAYTQKKLSIADYSKKSLIFETIQPFWLGYIEKIAFSDHYMLIKTTHSFYIAQMVYQQKIYFSNCRELHDHQISTFSISKYGQQVVIVTKDLSKIRTMKIKTEADGKKVPLKNQMINPGRQCIGGYSNQLGCVAQKMDQVMGYDYQKQHYKIQMLNDGMYHTGTSENKKGKNIFTDQKVKAFIRKNFIFPDKYRPITYKNMLSLPISKKDYLHLERKGRHSCVRMLDSRYPLDNASLAQAIKDIVSLLAHYSPIFAQSDLIPTLVFPFVCIFGQDRFFCFEILYRLFNNWLSFLFQNFPLANSQILQNILQIFEKQDPILLNHLNLNQISFTKLTWSLLSTLFSTNLNRDGFLAIADTLISHPEDPSFIIFMVIAYIQYNRTRILSMKKLADLDQFLDEEHTVNISNFIKKAYQLRDKLGKYVRYAFRSVNFRQNHYVQYDCYPKHAVKMYESKRKLQEQQYEKAMNQQRYHDQIAKQMEKMVTKVKRQSDKAIIQGQAVALQSQNQSKNVINLPRSNHQQRKRRLNALMTKLQQLMNNRTDKKLKIGSFIPLLNQINERENEQQLDQIQQKLMSLLTKLQPHQFHLPLSTNPMTFGKGKIDDFKAFRAAKRAQIANKLWETDQMARENEQARWEHDFKKAMEI